MGIKLKNKKKVILRSFIFLALCFNLIFAINSRLKNNSLSVSNTQTFQIALATKDNGNITIDENKHFKRYVIKCNKEKEQLLWEDHKAYIKIILNKEDITNFYLNGDKKIDTKELYYSNTEDGLTLNIKKNLNSNNYVSVDKNNKKNIEVLISKEDNPFIHSVVIDAGHGGIDKGANYGNIYEKNISFKIANYAARELEFNGFKVIQTRDDDKLLSLKEIGDITNSASADIFVSVHINENKDSKYKGVTTYYYDPNGFQKEERIKLAETMQNQLIKSDEWWDRGIIRQNFAVLRYSKIPSVLLECGFLSNTEDRNKLTQDSVLKNFGENIFNGIIEYFSIEKVNN